MNSGKSEKTPKIALRHSRIGLRMLFIMLAALVLGVIVYIGVTQLGSWAQNSIIYERLFSEEYKQEMLHDLQNYVADNGISSSDYMQISVWLSDNIGIGFFYDQRTPDNGDYVIQFADRAVSVVPYVTSNAYDQQITLVAAVLALAAALLIIAPYARRISSDIKHLSGDMALIAGGDLSHEVKLKGKTELAELAQSFDQMRLAIAARMERESEAVRANQELIGALSHDLRTPLTKQSSYLELALSERYKRDAAGMRACVEKASKATGELRERIEELFSYFLVFSGEKGPEPLLEDVDGTQVLARLLGEQAEFLRLRGFSVDCQAVPEGLRLRAYLPGLTRIFDNMTSNILRYADPAREVLTYVVVNGPRAFVHFDNCVREDADRREGTNIGCRSAARQAELMGGALRTERTGSRYYAILELPVPGGGEAARPESARGET